MLRFIAALCASGTRIVLDVGSRLFALYRSGKNPIKNIDANNHCVID
jgi:hypothetical protein